MIFRVAKLVLTLAVLCLPCPNLRADEPPVADLPAAGSEPVPGAQSENEDALYVLSLLDIPDGESAAFYENRRKEIEQAMRKYVGKTPTREEYDALMEQVAETYVAINKKIVESADFDKDASPGNFMLYCDSLVKQGALEEIETLLKEEKAHAQPNVTRVAALQIASVGAAIVKASDKGDGVMLRKIGAALVEKAAREPSNENLQLFAYGAAQLDRVDKEIAGAMKRKAFDRFWESENPTLRTFATTYDADRRRAELVGSEMRVEGLFLDGTPVDWSKYRGKVVLIDFWATWCGPCVAEIPNVRALYAKYHESGFEVLGYSLDSDPAALQKFVADNVLPWPTLSQKKSVEAKPGYIDLAKFYSVKSIPTMILVGRDGKVIDADAKGARLRQLLEDAFE